MTIGSRDQGVASSRRLTDHIADGSVKGAAGAGAKLEERPANAV